LDGIIKKFLVPYLYEKLLQITNGNILVAPVTEMRIQAKPLNDGHELKSKQV
jgi:hypothetical protein